MEKFFRITNRIMGNIAGLCAVLIGFGNAVRCAFFIDYPRFADKVFFTAMMACIGIVGLWLLAPRKED